MTALLNGSRVQLFRHFNGLRQGDTQSPMLFILAMEPLQRMLRIVSDSGLLSPLNTRGGTLRASLYADDAVLFFKPMEEDVQVVSHILKIFGHVSVPV
jgi:hypothetical protein